MGVAIDTFQGWTASRSGRTMRRSPINMWANRTPNAPPSAASTTLSVISWRMTRQRPAPNAARIAISLRRAAVRVNSNPARLAHAIKRTNATAPSRIISVGRRSPESWTRTGFYVFRTEAQPCQRFNLQNGKEVVRNGSTRDQLRLVASRKDKAFPPITPRDGFEALALLFPFDELRPGHRRCAFTSPSLPKLNHPIRFWYRQWSKQYPVDDAEDRRVRSDAEGEREHGHSGEAGVLQQLPEGEFEIIHNVA